MYLVEKKFKHARASLTLDILKSSHKSSTVEGENLEAKKLFAQKALSLLTWRGRRSRTLNDKTWALDTTTNSTPPMMSHYCVESRHIWLSTKHESLVCHTKAPLTPHLRTTAPCQDVDVAVKPLSHTTISMLSGHRPKIYTNSLL